VFARLRQRAADRALAAALADFDRDGPPCPDCGERMIPIAYGKLPQAPQGWTGPIKKFGCVVGPEDWWCERCDRGHVGDRFLPPVVIYSHPPATNEGQPGVRVAGITSDGSPLPYTRATVTIRSAPFRWKLELAGIDAMALVRTVYGDATLVVTLSNGGTLSGTAQPLRLSADEATLLGTLRAPAT
jgi:hypothetical protein